MSYRPNRPNVLIGWLADRQSLEFARLSKRDFEPVLWS